MLIEYVIIIVAAVATVAGVFLAPPRWTRLNEWGWILAMLLIVVACLTWFVLLQL